MFYILYFLLTVLKKTRRKLKKEHFRLIFFSTFFLKFYENLISFCFNNLHGRLPNKFDSYFVGCQTDFKI